MSRIFSTVSGQVWSPVVWLPPNITWEYFDNRPDFAQFYHLLYPLPMALVMVVLRLLLDRALFRPLGQMLGINGKKRRMPDDNAVLEAAFHSGQPDYQSLCSHTGLSGRQVHSWMRRRLLASKPTTLDKFTETGWRWTFYFSAHVLSVWALWEKPWVWNTFYCWYGYPFHAVDPDVWWHYMLEMAFYWSLTLTQFTDVKRKDFWEMFIHHIATLALLILSWTNHMHRMGSLVLLVHDFADHWMELAKLARYANFKKCCDISYIIFLFTWSYTRLGIFPTWIIYSTTIDAAQLVQMFPVYYIFNCLLSILLVLHIIWFYYIAKVGYKSLISGKTDDSRSDSDSDDEDSEDCPSDNKKTN